MLIVNKNGQEVMRVSEGASFTIDGMYVSPAMAGWSSGDYSVTEADPDPISVEDYSNAVQDHVDAVAKSRGYRHGDALAGHISDPRTDWSSEAQAFVVWRSNVWTAVYALWADPPDPAPSIQELIGQLPPFTQNQETQA